MRHKIFLIAAACMFSFPIHAYAGEWKSDKSGWYYQNEDGSYLFSTWKWIDGNEDGVAECYYFDENGYLVVQKETPDGSQVNEKGEWMVDGVIQKSRDWKKNDSKSYTSEVNGAQNTENVAEVLDDQDVEGHINRVILLINEERTKAGLPAFKVSSKLNEIAQIRAEELTESFSGTRPDGSDWTTAYEEVGWDSYQFREIYTENSSNPEQAVQTWIDSDRYKSILMNPEKTRIGVGYASVTGGAYKYYYSVSIAD